MAKKRDTFRKVITTPELVAGINPENARLMERFLKNFATKRSPNSVVNYRSNLTMFFCWNEEQNGNKSFKDVRKIELMDFFDYAVDELGWGPNRYCQMHSCLSSFSTWIENYLDDEDDYRNFRNILPRIERPVKENVRKKTVLQKDDVDRLFAYFEEKDMPQNACLLALAISCGARVSELARFTTDLIDENNTVFDGLFLETTDDVRTKGRGVSGKMIRKYILRDMFIPHYRRWLDAREKLLLETERHHDSVFVTKDGNPASADRLRKWISNWSDVVGQPCYPHMFRHYNVSMLKGFGLDDDLVVFLTGWSEKTGRNMISIYDDRSLADRNWKNLDKLKAAMDTESGRDEQSCDHPATVALETD